MDNRRYNIMMLEAEAEAQKILSDFDRWFYAREIRNAERNMSALAEFQKVMSEPVEEPALEPVPAIPTIEEVANG